MKILIVFGTRPEAIKMAPVIEALKKVTTFSVKVCVTAQHRQMLDQVLDLFGIVPDFDLNLMRPGQNLSDITSDMLLGMRGVLHQWRPDMVLVHGDTTSTFAAALAAFYEKITVGHVEAGLRSGYIYAPWPEEMNRRLVSEIAGIHFAPTEQARKNLLREGVSENTIHVTGNTVIDALLQVIEEIRSGEREQEILSRLAKQLSPHSSVFTSLPSRLILVTGHRRENFGEGFECICRSLRTLAQRMDVEIIYPVHLNPNVQEPVQRILGNIENIHLIEPLDYLPFVYLMSRSYLVITDSGGIQEEAPSLGKPVLVMRDITERPEAVNKGTVILVGTDEKRIVTEANRLLDDPVAYKIMSCAHNPYGDGLAAKRIASILGNYEVQI